MQLGPPAFTWEPNTAAASTGPVDTWAAEGVWGVGSGDREVMAGLVRASSVSLTLLQTKSLWGEGRRLPAGLGPPGAGCVRGCELVWSGALDGPAG